MLAALKAFYEMLKISAGKYAAREEINDDEVNKYKEEIATLKKENGQLMAEQIEAIAMIDDMAKYLKKN